MSYVPSRRSAGLLGGAILAAAASLAAPHNAAAQDLANFEVFMTGFSEPTTMVSPPGEPERIFVASLSGIVRVIENGVLLPDPFLDIRDRLRTSHGLIGMAFPPDYEKTRRVYVNYTALDTAGPRISRFTTSANPNLADHATEEILLETGPGAGDHNAGWIGFGHDGYLYIARGDVNGVPQSPNSLGGKILRIDVSPAKGYVCPPDNPYVGVEGRDEIAAIGLRNPWRNGFDSLTGDLYIADVGNLSQEEVNFVPAGTIAGRNFGWPCMEATICRNMPTPCFCGPPMEVPIHTYSHADGFAVIGGTVYRGSAIPRWRGRYFFIDSIAAKVWSFRVVNGKKVDLQHHTADLNEGLPSNARFTFGIATGTDGFNEFYVCEARGRILKMAPEFAPADWNLDGVVNSTDFFDFLTDFFADNADMTGDHMTGSPDFFEFLMFFFAS